MIITLCGSIQFIEQMVTVAAVLTAKGHTVLLPESANHGQGKEYWEQLWDTDQAAFIRLKQDRMLGHMNKIQESDAILVVNYEKHGQRGYVGPNTLMEIGHAFALQKKIYVWDTFDESSPFFEELISLPIIFLHTDIERL